MQQGSTGGRGPAGGSRAQCRFLLNSCWSSVWISSNTLWCITSVWQRQQQQQRETQAQKTFMHRLITIKPSRYEMLRRCQRLLLIQFSLKWSQEKSGVADRLIQAAETEPETRRDPGLCGQDAAA